MLNGKRVILVDDSIVRGTTSRKIVEMVRAAGAREVHMRISSPPTTHSCFYGIDTPERGKLLAARHDVAEMAELIGADSLAFISLDGLYRALGRPSATPASPHYCDACFTGDYPIAAARHGRHAADRNSACSTKDFGLMRLAGRVALVTGASRGIGAATAIATRRLGAHVVLTARTQGGLDETDDAIRAAGGSATLLPLDLSRPESLDAVGPSLSPASAAWTSWCTTPARSAASRPPATSRRRTWPPAWREPSRRLPPDPHLRPVLAAADAGRAVFVTSSVARTPRAYWGAYAATKAAMEMLVRCWADEVENTPLRVNLFDPGATATRMRATAFPGEDPRTLPGPESRAAELVGLCLPSFSGHGSLLRAA